MNILAVYTYLFISISYHLFKLVLEMYICKMEHDTAIKRMQSFGSGEHYVK